MSLLDNLSRVVVFASAALFLFGFSIAAPLLPVSSNVTSTSPTGIVIPLYTYPTDGTWNSLVKVKQTYPNVPMMAIVNPDSGPGSSYDQNYASGILMLRNAGVVVVGYVPTDYASNSISSVENEVNRYFQWYPYINGIMFDQMSNVPGNESYYSTLNSYVKSIGGNESFGNAGTSVPQSFIGTMNVTCIHEDSTALTLSSIQTDTYGDPKSNFAYIQYGSSLPNQTYITSLTNYFQWIYFTDAGLPNPYNSLPDYFSSLAAYVSIADSSSPGVSQQTVKVNIDSNFVNGTSFRGMWTYVEESGTIVAKGFTPFAFNATVGLTYTFVVDNYQNYVFDHWDNGNTSNQITLSAYQNMTLRAYYDLVSSTTTTSMSPQTFITYGTSQTDSVKSYSALTTSTSTTSSILQQQNSKTSIISTSSVASASSSVWHTSKVSPSSAIALPTNTSSTMRLERNRKDFGTNSTGGMHNFSIVPISVIGQNALKYALAVSTSILTVGSSLLFRSIRHSGSKHRLDRSWRW